VRVGNVPDRGSASDGTAQELSARMDRGQGGLQVMPELVTGAVGGRGSVIRCGRHGRPCTDRMTTTYRLVCMDWAVTPPGSRLPDHLLNGSQHRLQIEWLFQEAMRAVAGGVRLGVGQQPGIGGDHEGRDAGGIGIRA
jgi:hypothetical protein